MVVLGGVAVSYERGTPVKQVEASEGFNDHWDELRETVSFFFITLKPRVE